MGNYDAAMSVDGREWEAYGIGQPGTVNQDAVLDTARGAISFAVRPSQGNGNTL